MNLYKKVFTKLEEAKIKYLIVGGVAVNMYGYSRFTGDVDILLALNPTNLQRMDKLMHDLGYVERLPINIKELGDKDKLEEFIKKKALKALNVGHLEVVSQPFWYASQIKALFAFQEK